jgi:hypothetical protein
MHAAALLGNKFSIVDISEAHNMHMYNLVVRYRFAERCASIRNINFPLPRPALPDARPLHAEHERALAGARSEMVEAALAEAVAAIEEDGAEVIILGCSAAFWLQRFFAGAPRRDRLGSAGARRLSLRHRVGEADGQPRHRRERPRFPGRPPEEMAPQKGALNQSITRQLHQLSNCKVVCAGRRALSPGRATGSGNAKRAIRRSAREQRRWRSNFIAPAPREAENYVHQGGESRDVG